MTMPVAADSPPMKASSASAGCRAASGSQHEGLGIHRRAEVQQAAERDRQHEQVDQQQVGGNTQAARRRWRSSTFSTTITWNWRGRKITDSIASSVSANHWP
jgi:hypothetical protein